MERAPEPHVRGAARVRRAGAAAARGRPPVGRAAAARAPPGGRHRRAPDAGAGPVRAAGRAAAGALRLPGPRPGQGHDAARAVAAPPRPRRPQRGAGAQRWRSGCACRPTAANSPTWSRANTATCTAAASSAPRRCCGCSSAATRCAGRQRFAEVLLACECDSRGRTGLEDRPYAPATRLPPLLQAALAVDTAAVAEAAAARGAGAARPSARPCRRRAWRRCWRRCRPAPDRVRPAAGSDQQPDQHRQQAEHQRAGQRHVPLAAAEAKAEIARQPAEAELAQPGRRPLKTRQASRKTISQRMRRQSVWLRSPRRKPMGVEVEAARQADDLEQLAHLVLGEQLLRRAVLRRSAPCSSSSRPQLSRKRACEV